jgi:hypothetical protein
VIIGVLKESGRGHLVGGGGAVVPDEFALGCYGKNY